ncbi:putative pyroglutamyl peptidase type I [Xylariaceae sp. FL0255]|nr:putative pyroglutamyl peptidase type I [Xylariaceae sp. FL0255]
MGSMPTSPEDVRVLVTGFGPFREQYPVNPSWEIVARLPDFLPAGRVKNHAHQSSRGLPPVRIIKLAEPVRVCYNVVRPLAPKLWDDPQYGMDYCVHIGMAGPQLVYSLERQGHRDGYAQKDVDGELLDDEKRHAEEGEDWIWHGVPKTLLTDLDVGDVHKRWVARSPCTSNLRVSEDAGRYLCDFIYMSSLAHLWKQQRRRNVVFLHVPLHSDEQSITRGVELVLNLIRSLVESELEKKS